MVSVPVLAGLVWGMLSPCIMSLDVDVSLQPIFHTPGPGSVGYSGDPNGLVYRTDTKLYHFFWQHFSKWPGGGVYWGHAISKNFASWERMPDTLGPGAFSGGATQLASGDVKMLYKDVSKANRFFTASPADLTDPKLTKWIESADPTAMKGSTDPSSGWPISSGGFYSVVGTLAEDGRGAAALWHSDDSFSNFTAVGHNLFSFAWDRKNGAGGPGDKFQSAVPRDPNFFQATSEDASGPVLWAFEGAMKMCFFAGHDFYVLGHWNETNASFTPHDAERSMGSDPFDFGGSMFASQTFKGADGSSIASSWVLEGDCDITSVPPKCPAMMKRGWMGVHSLPRIVTVETTPALPGATSPRYSLKFSPLPALESLRTGQSATMKGLDKFRSNTFQINLRFAVESSTVPSWSWDVGTRLFWSDDDRESTRVGIRAASWLPGSELVFINDKQRSNSKCTNDFTVVDAKSCQSACFNNSLCIGWTAIRANASAFNCNLVCHIVPLLAVSSKDCNWGSLHDPTHSISGMKGRWASIYMDRSASSLTTPSDLKFPYAGLVRILDNETSVDLSIFADKSIVEAFAMDGRAALTGRVYPSLPNATKVGAYSGQTRIDAEAWEMGPAFVPPAASDVII